jgi:hypothetical protein
MGCKIHWRFVIGEDLDGNFHEFNDEVFMKSHSQGRQTLNPLAILKFPPHYLNGTINSPLDEIGRREIVNKSTVKSAFADDPFVLLHNDTVSVCSESLELFLSCFLHAFCSSHSGVSSILHENLLAISSKTKSLKTN